ncbi:Alpha/Beta hydrolase protein [Cunninghamella echinulata]|nr:Alpha/Beta hydrolase protein [Cunninghamella echinulata]
MKNYILLLCISLWVAIVYSDISLINNTNFEPSKDIIITSSTTNRTYHFKQPTLCDSVVQYSGYIKVTPTTKYFFWFFESRTNPDTAPLTLWLNGGPGCSSLAGLWREVGPCSINAEGTKDFYNERGSWNKISNMLFLDQPSGTGYSFGDMISSTKEATPLVYEFLLSFFDAFPKYKNNPFHLFGESYAGHYIPSIANYILERNKGLTLENQGNRINLETIGIGNGLISILIQDQYAVTMACNSTYGSVLNETDCNIMKQNTPKCIQRMEKCKRTGKQTDCVSATKYCANYVEKIYRRSGRRDYDVRYKNVYFFNYFDFIRQDNIKELLGVPLGRGYHLCNNQVKKAFYASGDYARDFAPQLGDALDQGIRVIIFAGDADFRGHWYGNHALTQQLNFKNNAIYQSKTLQPWLDQNGKEVGQYQYGAGLTFVRVYEAGHKAPSYQPEAAYDMFLKHINNGFL